MREGFVAHVSKLTDVTAVRSEMGLSQAKFANQFGFSVDAVRNGQHGRRQPNVAARAFLKAGRSELVKWLKYMENAEAHRARRQAQSPYDFSWIWDELGISDPRK